MAKCVFELDNKLSGKQNSTADTVVSPSPESALVDTNGFEFSLSVDKRYMLANIIFQQYKI
jgi:hypothetical protein